MEDYIFRYSIDYGRIIDDNTEILISDAGEIWQNGFLVSNVAKLDENDFEKIKNEIIKISELEEIGKDLTRERSVVISDGSYTCISIRMGNCAKDITISNLYQYLDEEGLSPSADKLISYIENINKIIKKYDFELSYGEDSYSDEE